MEDRASSSPRQPILSGQAYQPLYALPNGAWVMCLQNRGQNQTAAIVDTNGAFAPQARGSGASFDVKIFVLDANGQVIQIED